MSINSKRRRCSINSRKKRVRPSVLSRSPLRTRKETSLSDSYELSIVERKTSSNRTPPVNDNLLNIPENWGKRFGSLLALIRMCAMRCLRRYRRVLYFNPVAFFALSTQAGSFDPDRSRDHNRKGAARRELRARQLRAPKNDHRRWPGAAPCRSI